ncbi:MAG: protein kinase [Deltaproteobacteria bacterium]|nr:protein kinase [Deltaproteobacteria bacterium]
MLQAGEMIDIWVVERALGAGGMGSVYRCHNKGATRILAAIKVLEGDFGRRSADVEARFVREAEILFALNHPNIVRVRNVRVDHSPPYIEMEFVAGESIEDKLQRGALALPEALRLLREIASAVAFLHDQGIRHRDLKPANVLVEVTGAARIVDFGLAVETQGDRLTQGNMTFGTVSYAPPEWIHPDRLDPRLWDLYALGVMAYEMLTGEVAFPVSGTGSARQQAMQVVLAKQDSPPLDPGPAFEEPLRALVREMTHPDPQRRTPDARLVLQRLEQLHQSQRRPAGETLAPSSLPPDHAGEPPARPEAATWMDEGNATPVPRGGVTLMPEPARPAGNITLMPEPARPGGNVTLMPEPGEPLPPPETGERPARSRLPLALALLALGAVALVGLAALGVGAAYLPWGAPDPTAPRALTVQVAGVEEGAPVDLWMRDHPATAEAGGLWRFSTPAGEAQVLWALGEGCQASACAAGECAPWCAQGALSVPVPADQTAVSASLDLSPFAPLPREVALTFAEPPTLVRWPGAEVKLEGAVASTTVLPGAYTVRAELGSCPEAPCAPGSCPDGCAAWEEEVQVGRGASPFALEVPLKPPVPPVAAPAPTAEAPPRRTGPAGGRVPTEAAAPATPTAAGPVTNGQFARWLGSHPDWSREAAIGAGRADENYLAGWGADAPPAGAEGRPVVGVSWYAAAAYCQSRGGLAGLEDEPLTWSEAGGGLAVEYRASGGKTAFRTGDGMTNTGSPGKTANQWTGFRCAR